MVGSSVLDPSLTVGRALVLTVLRHSTSSYHLSTLCISDAATPSASLSTLDISADSLVRIHVPCLQNPQITPYTPPTLSGQLPTLADTSRTKGKGFGTETHHHQKASLQSLELSYTCLAVYCHWLPSQSTCRPDFEIWGRRASMGLDRCILVLGEGDGVVLMGLVLT